MKTKRLVAAAWISIVIGAVCSTAMMAETKGQDWPQFRGIHRDGRSAETGLLKSWPEGGPREVWRRPLGAGYSAVSVVGDRLYTMYAADQDGKPVEFAAAFNATDGDELWRVALGERFDTEFGNGPSATPTVDGDTVYVMDSRGNLAALATTDGKERWKLSLTETFGSEIPTFGFSMSPLVDGNQLIVEGGGSEGQAYAGLNKKTGEIKWSVGDTGPGYNSPLLVEVDGKKRYVYVVREKLMSIDENGKEIWSHAWPQGETHAMPLSVPPDRIYVSGAEGVGAKMLRVTEKGGKGSAEVLWETGRVRNHFSSAILHGEHIYSFDNATMKSIAVADASMAWGKRGLGKGALIYADGHLIALSDRGKLLLVEATPEGYVEKSSVQALEGLCWTAPSLAHGRLYLRNHDEIVAYDLGQ